MARRFRRLLGACLFLTLALRLHAGEPVPDDPPPTVAWQLKSNGEGVTKAGSITRDGKTFDQIMANGGNILTATGIRRNDLIKNPDGTTTQTKDFERMELSCELIFVEFDPETKLIERILCAGHVRIRTQTSAPDGTFPAADSVPGPGSVSRDSYIDAESLEFQRLPIADLPRPDPKTPTTAYGQWGLFKGIWKLHNRLPAPPAPKQAGFPAAFTDWLAKLPVSQAGRVLLRSDRLTLLAPEIELNPIAGKCTAGPDHVSGAFEPEAAPVVANQPVTATKSTGWSPLRRTVFAGQTLEAHFHLTDKTQFQPSGPIVLTGRVFVYQEKRTPADGEADLQSEQLTINWAKSDQPIAPEGPLAHAWQAYEWVAASALNTASEIVLRDNDLILRGGELRYERGSDTGTLKPLAGQKWVDYQARTGEANLQLRMRAEGFTFHLNERVFEAVGQRILENVPAAAKP